MFDVTTMTYMFITNGVDTKELKSQRGLRQGDPISPLLFVIVMEYLHKKLKKLEKVLYFNYHSNCEKLHIINLTFADDLLLFTRWDIR